MELDKLGALRPGVVRVLLPDLVGMHRLPMDGDAIRIRPIAIHEIHIGVAHLAQRLLAGVTSTVGLSLRIERRKAVRIADVLLGLLILAISDKFPQNSA